MTMFTGKAGAQLQTRSHLLRLKVGTSTIMTSDERGQRVNVANLSRRSGNGGVARS